MNTITTGPTENRDDTKRGLAQHTSGDLYIAEWCSLWDDDDDVVGTRIIAVAGPISRRDLIDDDVQLVPAVATFDRIDAWQDLTADDAAWLQGEEDAGRVNYPIGAR